MKKFLSILCFLTITLPAFSDSEFQPGQAKVTASVLNIRNIASSGGEVIGAVKRGDLVNVIERSKAQSTIGDIRDYWYKIKFTDKKTEKTGWLFGGYLSFELNMESGLRWKNLSPAGSQKLSAIAVSDSGEVYVGTEQGSLLVTSDKGKTWKKIIPQALGVNIGRINKILFSGKSVLIAAYGSDQGGVWKSANGGNSWTQLTVSQGLASNFVFDVAKSLDGDIYAATDKGVSLSKDEGTTWMPLSKHELKTNSLCVQIQPSGRVFMGTAMGLYTFQDVKGIFKSEKKWVRIAEKAPNMGNLVVTMAASSTGDIFVGTNKGLNRASEKNTDAWYGIGGQSPVNDILIENPSGRIIVATDNGLNISLDNGTSWATYKKENGLASNKVTKIAVNKKDNMIWIISEDAVSFHE